MPLPADTDVSSPKYLRDKYAIVGVGETTYTRGSGITTRALGTWAVRNAILDAGLEAADVDDSCPVGPDGKRRHTYDYRERGCRQVKDCAVTANLGWANPGTGSAMVMRRD